MDPRRCMILALLALLPAACAEAPPTRLVEPIVVSATTLSPSVQPIVLTDVGPPKLVSCRRTGHHKTHHARACLVLQKGVAAPMLSSAPPKPVTEPKVVIAAAWPAPRPAPPAPPLAQAAAGPHDHMDGAIKVFAYAPGRVFPVTTAPLRVTTLTLEPGEALIDKAAGDTVRWEIGDTTSGSGSDVRTLVMLKPLAAGLSTNLVLTTSKRVYLLDLASAARHADTDIAWSYAAAALGPAPVSARSLAAATVAPTILMGQVSGRYRIDPVGRRPSWTPAAVFDDGRRTFIAFGPDLRAHAAPLLFVDGPDGRPALVNYRQAGDLYIVDALFSHAELKLGDPHAEVVRLVKLDGDAS